MTLSSVEGRVPSLFWPYLPSPFLTVISLLPSGFRCKREWRVRQRARRGKHRVSGRQNLAHVCVDETRLVEMQRVENWDACGGGFVSTGAPHCTPCNGRVVFGRVSCSCYRRRWGARVSGAHRILHILRALTTDNQPSRPPPETFFSSSYALSPLFRFRLSPPRYYPCYPHLWVISPTLTKSPFSPSRRRTRPARTGTFRARVLHARLDASSFFLLSFSLFSFFLEFFLPLFYPSSSLFFPLFHPPFFSAPANPLHRDFGLCSGILSAPAEKRAASAAGVASFESPTRRGSIEWEKEPERSDQFEAVQWTDSAELISVGRGRRRKDLRKLKLKFAGSLIHGCVCRIRIRTRIRIRIRIREECENVDLIARVGDDTWGLRVHRWDARVTGYGRKISR